MGRTKIRFDLHGDPVAGETVWADNLGDNLYRLQNIPFHAFGFALGDVVRCEKRKDWEEVVGIHQDSGNLTIRIYFASASVGTQSQQVMDELASVGCEYERASPTLVAVSIPPTVEVPFSQISNYLNGLDDMIVAGWEVGKGPQQ